MTFLPSPSNASISPRDPHTCSPGVTGIRSSTLVWALRGRRPPDQGWRAMYFRMGSTSGPSVPKAASSGPEISTMPSSKARSSLPPSMESQ